MEITEVRIKLMEDTDDRLQAFCSVTFDDCFVVRDLKIIAGPSGPFVAMPSRKLTAHCPGCGAKNHLRALYCNHCGRKFREFTSARDAEGRQKLYADVAHPINSACRDLIQQRVIREYEQELERSRQPGYTSRYDDDFVDADGDLHEGVPRQPAPSASAQKSAATKDAGATAAAGETAEEAGAARGAASTHASEELATRIDPPHGVGRVARSPAPQEQLCAGGDACRGAHGAFPAGEPASAAARPHAASAGDNQAANPGDVAPDVENGAENTADSGAGVPLPPGGPHHRPEKAARRLKDDFGAGVFDEGVH